jgi:hypothetical protein
MIDVWILGYIVKYKLPSSIQEFPTWHISQLQDLLKMVKNFSMPHFFVTLIADEIHKHRNIKHILTSCFIHYKLLIAMYNGDPHMQFLPYRQTHPTVPPLAITSGQINFLGHL